MVGSLLVLERIRERLRRLDPGIQHGIRRVATPVLLFPLLLLLGRAILSLLQAPLCSATAAWCSPPRS